MRVVSFNILDGGTGREAALEAVIRRQRPDVVCLVEAEDQDVVRRLAAGLGMEFVHAPGHAHASALLSRWTISESVNHGLLHPAARYEKSLLEAAVFDSEGGQWTLGVVHLHAGAFEADERRREDEVEIVLEAFAPHRGAARPHLLAGDFNANSPVQRIDPIMCKEKTRKAWEANGGQVPRRMVKRLLDAGYVDVFHAVAGAAAETAGTFSTEHPGQRVDYLFAFGLEPGRLKEAWIERGDPAAEASDHFSVGAELAS